jgi:conjugal transfer pilus assembly protein TraD
MRQTYETDYRPNYELYLTLSWSGLGVICALLMYYYSGFTLSTTLALTAIFFLMAAYQGTIARSRLKRMKTLETQDLQFFSLDDMQEVSREDALYLGRGFEWTSIHAQKVQDLYHDPERLSEIKRERKGATYLHGIGIADEAPVYLFDTESKGHVHIVGTTGSGKTRLFDLIVTQCIMRNEPLIILDPKGDKELMHNAEATYQRLGRSKDFSFFHPAFVEESVAINPLASRQRSTELASRLAALIPSAQGGDVFKAFPENVMRSIFYATELAGTNPTIMDVQNALTNGFGPIGIKALIAWAAMQSQEIDAGMRDAISNAVGPKGIEPTDEQRAVAGARYYQECTSKNEALASADMNSLISSMLHNPDHLQKMVASLVPVIGKLSAGPLAALFSPDPAVGRMPKSGKVVSLEQVLQTNAGLYIGLDTLSDITVGQAMGQMVLADLASLAGKRYNFGRDEGRFINILVDEASEVTNDQLIQLLNKGRGAGFRIFVATQTLADYEAATGDKAKASQLMGNMNSTIMLRTLDPDTQERLAKRLPEVPLNYIMKTSATSLGDTTISGAFSLNHGERLMQEDKPIIAPQSFGDLSDLEYFAIFAKGNIIKGRLPILTPPEQEYDRPTPAHYSHLLEDGQDLDDDFENDFGFERDDMDETHPHSGRSEPVSPPSVIVPENPRYGRPVPPHRRSIIPNIRWIDVLPRFRREDAGEGVETNVSDDTLTHQMNAASQRNAGI